MIGLFLVGLVFFGLAGLGILMLHLDAKQQKKRLVKGCNTAT